MDGSRRHWIDKAIRALAIFCVFWAGAAFALAQPLPLVSLLLASTIAWRCTV